MRNFTPRRPANIPTVSADLFYSGIYTNEPTDTGGFFGALFDVLTSDDAKAEIRSRIHEAKQNTAEWKSIISELKGTDVGAAPNVPPTIPHAARNEHHMIVAGTGHGKTQCIQQMLLEDLESGDTIIVLDSQESMIEKLLHVVPEDRLMYLDGRTSLALSPFEIGDTSDDGKVTMALDLFQNMFAALETAMTTKQSTLYRYLCRLLMEIPNANFETALRILGPEGTSGYNQYVEQLPDISRRFFTEQYTDKKAYAETKRQVSERLYTLLENPAIGRMFNAPAGKVDIDQAIRDNKVVLINTAQSTLGVQGASIFGRYCLLQIAMEVLRRPETSNRVYFYIDEAQEYLTDSPIIHRLFEQGRKRGLCLVVAFHRLGQLGEGLEDALRTLTSIKFAGGVNASDATKLAKDMQTAPEHLQTAPKFSFAYYVKGQPSFTEYTVEPGTLEAMPQKSDLSLRSIRRWMHERYGYEPAPVQPNPRAPTRSEAIDPHAPQEPDTV